MPNYGENEDTATFKDKDDDTRSGRCCSRLRLILATCLLTGHVVVLTLGAVIVHSSDYVWFIAIAFIFMDFMLITKCCESRERPENHMRSRKSTSVW